MDSVLEIYCSLWTLYLIKKRVVSSSNSRPVGLSTHIYFHHGLYVVTRELTGLNNSNANLEITNNIEPAEQTVSGQKWKELSSIRLKYRWKPGEIKHKVNMIEVRWCIMIKVNACFFYSWFHEHTQSLNLYDMYCFPGIKNGNNTWKSWGLLAKALCLLRLMCTVLCPGLPGFCDVAVVVTPGLLSPPPPSSSVSPSSPPMWTAES